VGKIVSISGACPAPTFSHAAETFLVAHIVPAAWSTGTAVKYRQTLTVLAARLAELAPATAANVAELGTDAGARALADAFTVAFGALTTGLKGRRTDTLSGRERVGAGQEGQDLPDGAFPPVRFWQREVRLDVVAVAAAVLLLDHIPRLDQVGDDAEGAALGNVQAGRDVAQAHPGVMGDEQENPGVISQEGPAGHAHRLPDSGKYLLVS